MPARLAALNWAIPAAAAALAALLFLIAAWNALQAGVLPGLLHAAAQAQPMWFCH